MTDSKPFFTIIPHNVRNDDRLSASEKLFFGDLVGLSKNEGYCYASNTWLSNTFNVSVSVIRMWLINLEKFGYIERNFCSKNGQRKIYVTPGFSSKRGGCQNSDRGVSENCHHINKEYYLERENATPTQELSQEKEDLFEWARQEIPEDLLPHDEILSVLQEKDSSSADVAAALDYMSQEIARDKKKKHRQKIQSYVGIFRSKVKKLRNLRTYNQRRQND